MTRAQLAWAFASALLALCARPALARCHRLLVDHGSHEGSHAIALALTTETGAYHLGEMLDNRYITPGKEGYLWNKVLCEGEVETLVDPREGKWTTDTYAVDHPAGFLPAVNGIQCRDPNSVDAASTLLIRGEHIKALASCLKHERPESEPIAKPVRDVDIFILVRTDLMRWTLAQYGEGDPDYLRRYDRYSQFLDKPTVTTYKYRLDLLKKTASEAINVWKLKMFHVCWLLKAGFHPSHLHFVSYEHFTRDPNGTARKMASVLGGQTLKYKQQRAPERTRKVHSNNISTFALNAPQIHAMFQPGQYPSFINVLNGIVAHRRTGCQRRLTEGTKLVNESIDMSMLF
jgi:hypothetical protein